MPDLTFRDIVPGVIVASGGICNRGIVSRNGHVLVIDSGINAGEATPFRIAAQEYQKGGSLSLFNTHPHGDHVYGNQVFADSVIIAHEGVRNELVTNGEQTLAVWKQNPRMGAFISDVKLTLPTVTFRDQLTVFVGDIEVQLLYFGIAHSPSDSVAWLPQLRTLFTGDLLFNAIVPVMPPGGNSANWIPALERLEQLGAEHVIPGHGPVQTPAALGELRNWLTALRMLVGNAVKSGLDHDTAVKNVAAEMQAMAPRGMNERLPACIEKVFTELSTTH
jgi:cyclase